MARILLGVSGGIAAYKALELVRLATAAGHAVRAIQTPASQRFVGAASFAALTGAPVLTDEFERDPLRGAFPGQTPPDHDPLSHLELVRNADILVVAPASANTVAKLAAGLADNLLTSAALAATCPLLVAPAMNNHMWEHPATQANVATLRERGVAVLEPGTGRLASARARPGAGRLPEPAALLEAIEALDAPRGGPAPGGRTARRPARARHRRRHARADRRRALRRQPLVGPDGLRAGERGGARSAPPSPSSRRTSRSTRDQRVTYVDVETAAELQAACAAALPRRRRAADGGRRRRLPAGAQLRRQAQEGRRRAHARRARAHAGHPHRPGRGAPRPARRSSASPPSTATARSTTGARSSPASAWTRSSSTTSRAQDIGFDAADNEVTILTAAGETHVARASKAAGRAGRARRRRGAAGGAGHRRTGRPGGVVARVSAQDGGVTRSMFVLEHTHATLSPPPRPRRGSSRTA